MAASSRAAASQRSHCRRIDSRFLGSVHLFAEFLGSVHLLSRGFLGCVHLFLRYVRLLDRGFLGSAHHFFWYVHLFSWRYRGSVVARRGFPEIALPQDRPPLLREMLLCDLQPGCVVISQKLLIKSCCKTQNPRKFVNLLLIHRIS